MNNHQLLVIGPNGDDTYYVGDLGAGFRLAKRDRTVKMDYTQGAWTVEFLDHPDDPTSVAEWGKDPILEVALRYALGAMLGPIDSEYDADALAQALAAVDDKDPEGDRLERVEFVWSNEHGYCYDCGKPAAFWLPNAYLRPGESAPTFPDEHHKRCAVCAANAAVEGEAVRRINEDPELADHLSNYGQGTYALHYTSADAAGPDATWSVYREQYPTSACDVPIDGSTVKVSTHPNEREAETEADRLQHSDPLITGGPVGPPWEDEVDANEGTEFAEAHPLVPQRLTILANSDVTRGKYAAAAVHAALNHYGIPHGAVIVLGARAHQIEEQCDGVIRDAGRTEVRPGTVTAGIRRTGGSDV